MYVFKQINSIYNLPYVKTGSNHMHGWSQYKQFTAALIQFAPTILASFARGRRSGRNVKLTLTLTPNPNLIHK